MNGQPTTPGSLIGKVAAILTQITDLLESWQNDYSTDTAQISGALATTMERLAKSPPGTIMPKAEPQVEQASMLAFKHVDEVYVSLSRH